MTFLHPEFLYFMLLPIVVLFGFLLTQQEQVSEFFSADVMKKLRVASNRMSLRTRNLLFFLTTVLLLIALAQPVVEQGKVKVQAKSADLVIALDISDSMLAQDIYPSRLKQAKQKILELLAIAPKERIGVVAFAKESYLVSPLSFDFAAVRYLVEQLKPSYITEKGTDILQLLESVGQMMQERDEKYLLILSDGGDSESLQSEIEKAKALGITVFVLGIGTEQGAPIKNRDGTFIKENGAIIISKRNDSIADLALKTGGSYIEAVSGNEDIEAMLGEIAAKAKKRTLAEEEIMQYEQLFYYPLGLAMVLLLIATSSMTDRKRVATPLLLLFAVYAGHASSLQAGLLDFWYLEKAKEAYETGDFNTSIRHFGDVHAGTKSPEALYDRGNALYRSGRYEEAATAYKQVAFKEETYEFQRLHNLGNALAKQGSPEGLKEAVDAYERALKIKEEAPTRENLERIKAMLDQKNDKNDQQDDSQRNKGEKKEEQQKDKSGSKQQQSRQQQSQASDSKEEEPTQKSDAGAKNEQREGEQKSGKEAEKAQKDAEQPKQVKSAKDEKDENKAEPDGNGEAAEAASVMSDIEAEKWFKSLNDLPASHVYKISPNIEKEEKEYAKPW